MTETQKWLVRAAKDAVDFLERYSEGRIRGQHDDLIIMRNLHQAIQAFERMNHVGIDYSKLTIPKGRTRKQEKARKKRQQRQQVGTIRAAVVERTGGKCERCRRWVGTDGHAHHRIPRSRGGKWTMKNIQLLCPWCHAKAHSEHDL